MLRLSGAIIQRVIRGLEIRGWRRCVLVEITSRTRNGRVWGRVAGRSRGAHEQFLILEASVRAGSVGSCAIAMLLRSAIERIPMGMVIALTEAWVPAQGVWLVHGGRAGSSLWDPDRWGRGGVVVLALGWVGIMVISHDGWMDRLARGTRDVVCLECSVSRGSLPQLWAPCRSQQAR